MNIIKPSHRIVRCTEDGIDAIAEAARTCYLSEPQDSPELREQFIGEVVGWAGRGKPLRAYHNSEFDTWIRDNFVTKLRKMGHQTPFEFMHIEIEFVCDRGVSHEAVRHRMCSPMQESTRYCNYSENGKHGMNVIDPIFFDRNEKPVPTVLPVFHGETKERLDWAKDDDDHGIPPHADLNKFDVWFLTMGHVEWAYDTLLAMGASPQEARSVLPNSLKTKLKINANVREWWHIFKLRAINSGAHPQIREVMIPALKECTERWPILFEWLLDELKDPNPMSGKAKPKEPHNP